MTEETTKSFGREESHCYTFVRHLVCYQGNSERLADLGGVGGCKVHDKKESAFSE